MSKIIRTLSTTPTQSPNLYSTIKDNSQTILTLIAVVGGSFAVGSYFVEGKQNIKIVEEKLQTTKEIAEEKIKSSKEITEEKIKTSEERSKKESLERLFNIITQAEYESAKKTLQSEDLKKSVKASAKDE